MFDLLRFKEKLRQCFRHLKATPIFGHSSIVLLLVVHFILGCRELRQIRYYQDDPVVRRLLRLTRLPDVTTVNRYLSSMNDVSVNNLHLMSQDLVLQRLVKQAYSRITIDFDGSVIGTGRYAEGTAIGFNKKKKGQRSYYSLFCTVAQTGQVLGILHRSGNVHNSNGAEAFILKCIEDIRTVLPHTIIELRMDGAFFSDRIIYSLKLMAYHNGRDSQEGIFAELKPQNALAYVPTRTWRGNQVYMLSAVLAHNLARELHMITHEPTRKTEQKRPACWDFRQLNTLRQYIIQRAGRLIRPQGQLVLSMSANTAVQDELLQIMGAIDQAS